MNDGALSTGGAGALRASGATTSTRVGQKSSGTGFSMGTSAQRHRGEPSGRNLLRSLVRNVNIITTNYCKFPEFHYLLVHDYYIIIYKLLLQYYLITTILLHIITLLLLDYYKITVTLSHNYYIWISITSYYYKVITI